MTERVAIVGSREHPNLDLVREYVRGLPFGSRVISGGAIGVDSAAVDEARRCRLVTVDFLPRRQRDSRDERRLIVERVECEDGAFTMREVAELNSGLSMRDVVIFRNSLIAMYCTRMVAFVDGSAGGTWDAVAQAKRFKRPVEIVRSK